MVRYLVALDADEGKSKLLLDGALRMVVKGRDSLLLARVVPEADIDTTVLMLDSYAVLEEQMKCEAAERKKLEELDKACIAAKVDSSFVVITDDHPGNALCKAARENKIDCMIVGRRELGAIKRFLTYSTSKYCVDHADCNVLVFKRPYPKESAPQVDQKENEKEEKEKEEERQRRQMASEGPATLSSGRIWTLRAPGEFLRAFEHARPEQRNPVKDLEASRAEGEAEQPRKAKLNSDQEEGLEASRAEGEAELPQKAKQNSDQEKEAGKSTARSQGDRGETRTKRRRNKKNVAKSEKTVKD